ncbi:MAG: 12,18-didecarboxysiroheme deacetylase [Kiritimatiellae bacterium]|nr:12,18-didecarboxysiroheme deacetylase [Kiritimatiellia bacterium]
MIGISKLYLGQVEPSDALRYGRHSGRLPSHLLQFSRDKKPVVVWNVTQRCNLRCVHCYAHAVTDEPVGELSTEEGVALLDNLADFGVPVILFSGGEPLARRDLPELADHAVKRGMRAVISTNGTMISDSMAARLKSVGLSYVGVSLDGLQATNDKFRGVDGAFEQALQGIRNCQANGIKVGLRYTITKANAPDLDGIFDLIERENIPRVCFYHLVYTGRGEEIVTDDLDHATMRRIVDTIIDRTADMHARGLPKEVLTVDNHADGPYLYLRMLEENHPQADKVMELLKMNGGNSTGHGIGCVSWDGTVYPDQFWRHHPVGNVREKPFSEIWGDDPAPLLKELREKPKHVTGRCAQCRFLDICGGNLRARGEAVTGDVWGVDPACYLTDEEIGIA